MVQFIVHTRKKTWIGRQCSCSSENKQNIFGLEKKNVFKHLESQSTNTHFMNLKFFDSLSRILINFNSRTTTDGHNLSLYI